MGCVVKVVSLSWIAEVSHRTVLLDCIAELNLVVVDGMDVSVVARTCCEIVGQQ